MDRLQLGQTFHFANQTLSMTGKLDVERWLTESEIAA